MLKDNDCKYHDIVRRYCYAVYSYAIKCNSCNKYYEEHAAGYGDHQPKGCVVCLSHDVQTLGWKNIAPCLCEYERRGNDLGLQNTGSPASD